MSVPHASSSRLLIERLLQLLFPERCVGCARCGGLLCAACAAGLQRYPGGLRGQSASLAEVRIVYLFSGVLRDAVHQLKYRRRRRMAVPLGALLAEDLRRAPLPADAIVAVPLHAGRLAERGFNQAEEIAREVALRSGIPLVREGLVRSVATQQQARLTRRERQENMHEVFAWEARSAPPRRIIVVDDVITTGATLGACAGVLRAAGAVEVRGLALGRSRPDW